MSKGEARTALGDVLKSGLVSPFNGASVLAALDAQGGCGLLDRLIADDYRHADLVTLTLDERMANLPAALLLRQLIPAWGGRPLARRLLAASRDM